jgi:NAD(P)-dependent dehydrogenase (short-subunit alcohol dehydrogenase family)
MDIVLITGASKGIGFALAKHFLKNNFKVIGTSRHEKIEQIDHKNFEAIKLDLADSASITKAANKIKSNSSKINILINNAGVGFDLDTFSPEEETFENTFAVNVTGTVFFTESILPCLAETGKLINISSKMGSVELCQQTDAVAYRMSKSALNMYSKILANRLHQKQKVAVVHPGWVRTTIAKSNVHGRLSAEESATGIYNFVTGNFKSGIFWNIETQSEIPW